MVIFNEVGQKMFWGVTLDTGKRYTQVVQHAFHISMAALEVPQKQNADLDSKIVSVMAQSEESEFLLCSLRHGQMMNQPLDLNFNDGEEITFFLNGSGCVHLTGYLVLDDAEQMEEGDSRLTDMSYDEDASDEDMSDDEEEEDDDEDSDDDDIPELQAIDDMSDDDDDEDEEDDDEIEKMVGQKKRKKEQTSSKKKKQKTVADLDSNDDSDEDDDDFDISKVFEEDDSDEESDMDSDEDDLEGSFLSKKSVTQSKPTPNKNTPKEATPKGKKQKDTPKPKQQAEKKDTPSEQEKPAQTNGTSEKKKKKKKKKNKNKDGEKSEENNTSQAATPNSEKKKSAPLQDTPMKKRVVEGGVTVEDFKLGHGPFAKAGKMISVYYTGKLLQGGKVFDSNTKGRPFSFKLGKQEVIKGWDVGVLGMKVGGKRKLIIPAKMAYGNQRLPDIPPNSTLCFDVELKGVQ